MARQQYQERGGIEVRREHLHRLKHRPKPLPVWAVSARRLSVIGVGALLMLGTVYFLWSSGWMGQQAGRMERAWLDHTVRAGLAVRDVLVDGRRETSPVDVLMAVEAGQGAPMLSVDLNGARERLERLPWVRSAVVERRFPSTIFVEITERQPIGLWQRDGKHALVDETATVLATDGLGRWQGLPVLIGEGAPQHAQALLVELKRYPELYRRVEALTFVHNRRWTLHMANNVQVLLPEDEVATALMRLSLAQRDNMVLDKAVRSIDLRQSDRLVIMPTEDAITRSKAGKKGI
jgi:cell division protein FtsQ